MKTIKVGPKGSDVRLSSGVSQRYQPNAECQVTEAVAKAMEEQKCDFAVLPDKAEPKKGKD